MSLFLPFVFPSDLGFAKRRCVSVCEKEEKEIADFFAICEQKLCQRGGIK